MSGLNKWLTADLYAVSACPLVEGLGGASDDVLYACECG
jgi:hypothetical protein